MIDDTELLRQVHPTWIQAGRATSLTFQPSAKDEGKLSTDDGDQIAPHPAWEQYTARGLRSGGVLAVTVGEFKAEELPAVADGTPDTPFHVSVNYTAFSKSQCEKKSKRLRDLAHVRGWRYVPSG